MAAGEDVGTERVEQPGSGAGGLQRVGVGPEAPGRMDQLRRRVDDVAGDDCAIAVGTADRDADVSWRVARGREYLEARTDLIAVGAELDGVAKDVENGVLVRSRRSRAGDPMRPLRRMDHVTGVREREPAAGGRLGGRPAHMVAMQMCEDDEIDRLRRDSASCQIAEQPAAAVRPSVGGVRTGWAEAEINQRGVLAGADEKRADGADSRPVSSSRSGYACHWRIVVPGKRSSGRARTSPSLTNSTV